MGGGGGSGSGGTSAGGSGGGSGRASSNRVACENLSFETTVSSPDPTVVATSSVGDVCDIVLLTDPTRIALLTRPGGDVLGAIANRWEELVGCIGRGFVFEAVLVTVSSPVRVLVQPAS